MALYTCHCCGKQEEGTVSWMGDPTYPQGWHLRVIVSPQSSEFRGSTLGLTGCCIQCHEAISRAAEVATQRYIPGNDLSFMDWIKQLCGEYIRRKELERQEEEKLQNKRDSVDKSEDV